MTITFRGAEYEVRVRDHGYDPDTNSHDIEWWFDPVLPPGDPVTEEESEVIDQAIRERLADPHHYDDPD